MRVLAVVSLAVATCVALSGSPILAEPSCLVCGMMDVTVPPAYTHTTEYSENYQHFENTGTTYLALWSKCPGESEFKVVSEIQAGKTAIWTGPDGTELKVLPLVDGETGKVNHWST